MAKVFVYDAYTNKFYKYNLSENDPMPYSYGNTMRLREFRGSSNSQTLWTTVAAMEAWNLTRRRYGKGIYIGYAYKRIWEGGHGTTSQHYAGVSFDVGQNVSSAERVRIRDAAVATKAWGYVEPISMTPRWVHFDRRYGTAACSGVGYPTVRRNSRNTYVLILQDGLNYLIYFLLLTGKQRKQAISKKLPSVRLLLWNPLLMLKRENCRKWADNICTVCREF